MLGVKKSIMIDAPIEKVFGFMEDPRNLPEICTNMIEIYNVKKNDKGWDTYDWVYIMGGKKFEGQSDTVAFTQNKSLSTETTGGIQSYFDLHCEELESKTQVMIECTYSIPVPLVGKIAEKIIGKLNENEAEITIANLKARMEE